MRRMFRRFKMMQKHWFWNLCIESPLGPCTSRTPPLLYLMQNAVPTLYAAMVLRCGGRRYSPVKVDVEGKRKIHCSHLKVHFVEWDVSLEMKTLLSTLFIYPLQIEDQDSLYGKEDDTVDTVESEFSWWDKNNWFDTASVGDEQHEINSHHFQQDERLQLKQDNELWGTVGTNGWRSIHIKTRKRGLV